MAINLKKIRADLSHADPQIQTFALMSITRLSPQLVDKGDEIRHIVAKLEELIGADNPDVVFLARKAANHLNTYFPVSDQSPEEQAETEAVVAEVEAAVAEAATVHVPPSPFEMHRDDLLSVLAKDVPDETYLASVISQLVEKGKTEDLQVVTGFLTHPNARVRSNTIEVFTTHGDQNHVDLLRPLLADKNNRVRGNTVLALERLGYAGVQAPIEEMLAMSMISMRESAVYVLSQMRHDFVEPLLIRCLNDPYDGIRLRAVKALSTFSTRDAVLALKRMLNDMDINVCEAAMGALRHIKASLEKRRSAQQGQAAPTDAAAAQAVDEAPPPASAPETAAQPQGVVPSPAKVAPAATDGVFRELGTEIYHLCRANALTHEQLDNTFYEILRYQDFLRAYLVRKQKGQTGEMDGNKAISQLQDRIKLAFVQLGQRAWKLMDKGEVRLPDEGAEEAKKHVTRLKQVLAHGGAGS